MLLIKTKTSVLKESTKLSVVSKLPNQTHSNISDKIMSVSTFITADILTYPEN
jgi:hypothetical protein